MKTRPVSGREELKKLYRKASVPYKGSSAPGSSLFLTASSGDFFGGCDESRRKGAKLHAGYFGTIACRAGLRKSGLTRSMQRRGGFTPRPRRVNICVLCAFVRVLGGSLWRPSMALASISSLFGAAGGGGGGSALARARALAATLPDRKNASTEGGETEHHDFWVTHASLFNEARKELGPLHASLYDLEAHEDEFIDSRLRHAVSECERAAAAGEAVDESLLRSLLLPAEAVPGVYKLPMFTPKFCQLLLEEYRHHDASGIPLRRPNGMNRFGAILDELGLEPSLRFLSRRYLRPLGQLLYPWLIAEGDADEHYGFLVRYKPGEDVSLAEHADASVLTLNANLCGGFTGGSLAFRGTRWVDAKPQQVPQSFLHFSSFQPGEAILHLGGQYHSALPIESGERANLIVWLFGKHGVVRFAAHDETDRLDAQARWRAFANEQANALANAAITNPDVSRADVGIDDEHDEL